MGGILEIVTPPEKVEHLSYYTLEQLDIEAKKEKMYEIYMAYKSKRIKLRCSCSTEKIPMSINYIRDKDSYYLKSFPKRANKHSKACHFFKESTLSSDTYHKKNCEELENGSFKINLDTHDFKVKKKKKKSPKKNTKPSFISESDEISRSHSKLSIRQLTRLIVTKAWNDYIFFQGKEKYPNLSCIFNQIYRYTTKKYMLGTDVNLNKLLYKAGKPGQIYYLEKKFNFKYQPFAILLLDDYSLSTSLFLLPLSLISLLFTFMVLPPFLFFTLNLLAE